MRIMKTALWTSAALIGLALIVTAPAAADVVHADDVIIQGSACVGFDCVNGESFGFDTIRLKENNLRIRAFDTSTSASFPTRDWQITFNDTTNGGAEKFSIDDIDGGRTPFTIEAGTRSHQLYVDSAGRVGFGTNTPVTDLHVKSGNTPTLRLEQDGTSGFTAQTWDVAGNEANFFIRDATSGSTLPFRIFPAAPSNSLIVEGSTGDVGIGTTSPENKLHIARTTADRTGLRINNSLTKWDFEISGAGNFQITEDASGGAEFVIDENAVGNQAKFRFADGATILTEIEADGDIRNLTGVYATLSDRTKKTDIRPVDPRDVLAKVSEMPISTWRYTHQTHGGTHLGPMAQDFWAAFGLDEGDKSIALNDLSGVALAAIQGLNEVIVEKDTAIRDLLERVEALEAKLAGE